MNQLWPIMTVVFSLFLVPGSRLHPRLALALVLSIAGLALANWQGIVQACSDSTVLPYLLGALAGVSWGLYSAVVARWREWCQHYAIAPAGFLMIGLVGIAGCLITGEWYSGNVRLWLVFIYMGIIPNAAGYMLWEMALHRMPAVKLGILGASTPVLSTLCLFGMFAVTGQSRALPDGWPNLLAGAGLITVAVLLVSARMEWSRLRRLR
jgi:drug/metabolite transporter (DMT)-like permease